MKRFILTIFLVGCVLFSSVVFAKINPEIDNLLFKIKDEFNVYNAIKKIEKRIEDDPKNFENYWFLSLFYIEGTEDYQKALEAMKTAVIFAPEDYDRKELLYGRLAV